MTLDQAALMIIKANPGIFSGELFAQLREGGWSDSEITECLRMMRTNGIIDRVIDVRPRIVTRWKLMANRKPRDAGQNLLLFHVHAFPIIWLSR